MSHKLTAVSFCNMCMLADRANGTVLALDKQDGNWRGVTFPGGHIEPGESIRDSVIREMREETGLTISNPKFCGIVDWCNAESGERYLVLLYRAEEWSGTLTEQTEEGRVFWVTPDEMRKLRLAPNMDTYLEQFLSPEFSESFALWSDTEEVDSTLTVLR